MSVPERAVFVVDDDADVRSSICALVSSMGLPCRCFASAEEFLEGVCTAERGAVIVDLRMPGRSGLELQEELARRKYRLPVIILTAYARTSAIVKAVQAGAVTAIDKPYHDDDLWDAIRAALDQEQADWEAMAEREEIRRRIAKLTPEQRRVAESIVAGRANKQIANELGLGLRTVEKRRHEVYAKLRVGSVAELVAMFLQQNDPT